MKTTHDILRRVVETVSGKTGWSFYLVDDEDEGLRLVIKDSECRDAYDPSRIFGLRHYFPVPTATYNEQSWRRWVFECCRGVENHELGEWIRWGDERPFAPLHGPGENPYVVNSYRTDEERRTTQNGSVRPAKMLEIGLPDKNDLLSGEQVRELIDKIRDFQRDGGILK